MNILILGRGNYCKCILKNYCNKAKFYTIDNYSKNTYYDYIIVTYPVHVLKKKLSILLSINWKTLIHSSTNGSVLEKYIHYIKHFSNNNFIFLQFGIWHTRDGVICKKYKNIPCLVIGKNTNLKIVDHLFDIKLFKSDNILEFIINYHNTILHTILSSSHTNREYFYDYTLEQNVEFSNQFSILSEEMDSIYKQYSNESYNFHEKKFYFIYKYYLTLFIPLVMLQIKFPSKNSRIYNEDLDSLYYIYKNRKNINTPFIETILKINKYGDDNKTISIDNVVKFYKGKINKINEKIYLKEYLLMIIFVRLILMKIKNT
jgi:hypothetical protein